MDYDLFAVAHAIEAYADRRGCVLSKATRKVYKDLVTYVLARRKMSTDMIEYSRKTRANPEKGYWIAYHCDMDSWEREVMRPVFGSVMRIWEIPCPDWRKEIFAFLEMWITVPEDVMKEFDMTSEDEPPGDDYGDIDPFLIENGLYKRKS